MAFSRKLGEVSMDNQHRQEVRDGMMIEWDAPIAMDDGIVLRADIYRPVGERLALGVGTVGQDDRPFAFADSRPFAWKHLVNKHPNVLRDSSNKYVSWEVVDPEIFVPDGYAIVRIDSRGMGRSPAQSSKAKPRATPASCKAESNVSPTAITPGTSGNETP